MGGELPGAWVFVHEHAPQGQKNTYIGFLSASVVSGILLGSLVYIGIYMVLTSLLLKIGLGGLLLGLEGFLVSFLSI
ncbi:hypothetical protein Taiwan902_12750 [Helicobacter pylori]